MATQREQFVSALENYAPDFGVEIRDDESDWLADYYELLLKWNERLHLVAPCSPDEFAVRHVLESLMVLKHLPVNPMIVDVGSGGGLPIVPCLLGHEGLRAILIESSKRKAVFLREALRGVSGNRAQVLATRFEDIKAPESNVLTCRALDRFSESLPALLRWARPGTTLLLFAGDELRQQTESMLQSAKIARIPHSQRRFLIIANKPKG